jgi:dTMP kinase
MKGLFITFEGNEGAGKSTQLPLLVERLKDWGHTVKVFREPGGTPIGEEIRHTLKHSHANAAMTAEAELLLMNASRAQLVREVIVPTLAEGTMVLADRFLDSTTVYQGVARRLDPAQVATINNFAVGSVLPDLTFVLDLDPEVGRRRMLQRTLALDRMESQPTTFYEAVRAGYLTLASENPARIRLLDAAEPLEMIASKIWDLLHPLLPR